MLTSFRLVTLLFLSTNFVRFLQVQEVMQPMQQVMSDAESILATEPKVGFNIGQAKEELAKVNVCTLTVSLSGFIFISLCGQPSNWRILGWAVGSLRDYKRGNLLINRFNIEMRPAQICASVLIYKCCNSPVF